MYLQITTKCNMACAHCCYSCAPGKGKHMTLWLAKEALRMAADYSATISIGGGEPTLHPDFFEILEEALQLFEHVWFATNGTQTATMRRVANIINCEDYNEDAVDDVDREDYPEGDEGDDEYQDAVDEARYKDSIFQEDKLSVALSQDPWHPKGMVDDWVFDYWTRMSKTDRGRFEIRNVSLSQDGPYATGRAKKTGVGWAEGCVCGDHIVKVNGDIRACGCTRSPVIGAVPGGIWQDWQEVVQSDDFVYDNCYRGYRKRGGKRP